MSENTETIENTEVESLEVETEVPEVESEEVESEEQQEAPTEDEEIEIIVDGEEEPSPSEPVEPAPDWIKQVRQQNREAKRKIKELESKLQMVEAGHNPEPTTLPEKPVLADYDYNEDLYEEGLLKWYETKRQVESRIEQQQKEVLAQQKAYQNKLSAYEESKKSLKIKDFEDAELVVIENLDNIQQGIIIKACKNPAHIVAAIGKSQERAKHFAAIKDPVDFAFAVAKFEEKLKEIPKKPMAQPEKRLTSGASGSTLDTTLDKLRAEAEKSGDYSKVYAYKRKSKQS